VVDTLHQHQSRQGNVWLPGPYALQATLCHWSPSIHSDTYTLATSKGIHSVHLGSDGIHWCRKNVTPPITKDDEQNLKEACSIQFIDVLTKFGFISEGDMRDRYKNGTHEALNLANSKNVSGHHKFSFKFIFLTCLCQSGTAPTRENLAKVKFHLFTMHTNLIVQHRFAKSLLQLGYISNDWLKLLFQHYMTCIPQQCTYHNILQTNMIKCHRTSSSDVFSH